MQLPKSIFIVSAYMIPGLFTFIRQSVKGLVPGRS